MKISQLLCFIKEGSRMTKTVLRPVIWHQVHPEIYQASSVFRQKLMLQLNNAKSNWIDLPTAKQNSYIEIFDQTPLLDMNLPCITNRISITLPNTLIVKEITEPSNDSNQMNCKGGLLRIRRKKMNKHKYKKRKKRDRAKIRKILIGRERVRRRKRANKKMMLQKKVNRILDRNPKSTYPDRPYVVHRLTKW